MGRTVWYGVNRMDGSQELPEWVVELPADEQARMRAHLKRRRRVQDAVRPNAEHLKAERQLRHEAATTSDPHQRLALLRQADHHARKASELVKMVERMANDPESSLC